MENRIARIDAFIKDLVAIYHLNPDVYGTLVRNGIVSTTEEVKPIKQFFQKWIEKFENKKNIDAHIYDSNSNFFVFENGKCSDSTIKMYIPLSATKADVGVTELFEFIESSGYTHSSKVGADERTDNVIVRVDDESARMEIANFVNSNRNIKSGLLKPNPFCITDMNIAYASDNGLISYNHVLKKYLVDYITTNIKTPNLLCAEHFKNFLAIRFNDFFVTGKYLWILENDLDNLVQKNFDGDVVSALVSYQQITELLMLSMDAKSNLKTFKKHVEDVESEAINKIKYNNIKKLRNKRINTVEQQSPMSDARIETLRESILVTADKYGTVHVENALSLFIKKADASKFTRENDVRKKLIKAFVHPSEIAFLIKSLLGTSYKSDSYIHDFVVNCMPESKENYLDEACTETFKKYGDNQVKYAVTEFIGSGDVTGFTRLNNTRANVKLHIRPETVKTYLMTALTAQGVAQNTVTDDNIVQLYIDGIKKMQEESIKARRVA